MTSDFFLEEADKWRDEVWRIMEQRSDVVFYLLTKRPERVFKCLPKNWNNGWENIFFNVTTENQKRADERIPILLDLPFKHKGIMAAPFIGKISIEKYLKSGQIEQVTCGGENYDGARPLYYEWVKSLHDECFKYKITFCLIETGTIFFKDGKKYINLNKTEQSKAAYNLGLNFLGKKIDFKLKKYGGEDLFENNIFGTEVHKKFFWEKCKTCASRIICNGCSKCGKCKEWKNNI